MGRNNVSNPIGLGSVRQAVQLQQHHAGNAQPLTNDTFAKIQDRAKLREGALSRHMQGRQEKFGQHV